MGVVRNSLQKFSLHLSVKAAVELFSLKKSLVIMIISIIILFALKSVFCNGQNRKFKDDEIHILKSSEVQISSESKPEVFCKGVMVTPLVILTGRYAVI